MILIGFNNDLLSEKYNKLKFGYLTVKSLKEIGFTAGFLLIVGIFLVIVGIITSLCLIVGISGFLIIFGGFLTIIGFLTFSMTFFFRAVFGFVANSQFSDFSLSLTTIFTVF